MSEVKMLNNQYNFLRKVLTFLLCIIFLGCNKKDNIKLKFSELDFTYGAGMGGLYSLKIDSVGNFFIGRGRHPVTVYYGQLNNKEKCKLDSIYSLITFDKMDSLYVDKATDLSSYSMIIRTDNKVKYIFVYGEKEPSKLKEFSDYLKQFTHNTNFNQKDTIITFESLEKGYPTPPPSSHHGDTL